MMSQINTKALTKVHEAFADFAILSSLDFVECLEDYLWKYMLVRSIMSSIDSL